MRLFIAINFNEEAKTHIIEVQNKLRQLDEWANFTAKENLHLTLAFLGELPAERIAAIKSAMRETEFSPMELVFDHVGAFSRDGYDTCWIGLRKNSALLQMQNSLSIHLSQAGFPLEKRRFTPHLTIARRAVLREPLQNSRLLPSPFPAQIKAINLMESSRIQGKLCYTELFAR